MCEYQDRSGKIESRVRRKTSEMEARSDYDRNEQRPEILRPYASNFLYNAAGAVTSMRLTDAGLALTSPASAADLTQRERESPGTMSFRLHVTTALMITLQEKQQSRPDPDLES